MSQNLDQHYIERALNGDTRAYAVLIDRYKHMVYTMAAQIVKNNEDAEEVAQDVFLKAFKALNSYKGDAKFSTWLYKIAYYRSLDYLKKKQRRISTTTIDVSREYSISALDSEMDDMEVQERQQMVKKAIQQLPEDDGVLITLHYYEELSLKEISEIMGNSPNALKVRLHRARKKLADLLKSTVEPEILNSYGGK
ncbi:RNA polymerase sigma factor [Poritiphilus flavus]|uniref:RNA polymerase sigma factor n=1 Tax=Poritiphilus flavus TaxID=2697053 RepID=A0A6L9EB86_9FLAO|nr:sigma-70 family RNA polymerase sigma factor [Poritiphilus flavus]NAS11842.1 sigma-70 family RNA polymerase sigma factor [Poritiphilus flavus]